MGGPMGSSGMEGEEGSQRIPGALGGGERRGIQGESRRWRGKGDPGGPSEIEREGGAPGFPRIPRRWREKGDPERVLDMEREGGSRGTLGDGEGRGLSEMEREGGSRGALGDGEGRRIQGIPGVPDPPALRARLAWRCRPRLARRGHCRLPAGEGQRRRAGPGPSLQGLLQAFPGSFCTWSSSSKGRKLLHGSASSLGFVPVSSQTPLRSMGRINWPLAGSLNLSLSPSIPFWGLGWISDQSLRPLVA